ncbi:MAG: MarR family transcriptional regulator [Humibacillus sp.]|nr:MarR family transcriptional regulator [Humibacillus sp.]MDN5778092.1 MarR family transcriptional regulator [Humibacillus sp.]
MAAERVSAAEASGGEPVGPIESDEAVEEVEPWSQDAVLGSLRRALVGSNRLQASMAAELGVNLTGLSALSHLAAAPGMTPKQLSDLLGITTGSTTGAVDNLVKAGFLRREPHPDDRRSVELHLTPTGRHSVEQVIERYRSALSSVYAQHPDTAPDELASFLDDLAQALNRSVP